MNKYLARSPRRSLGPPSTGGGNPFPAKPPEGLFAPEPNLIVVKRKFGYCSRYCDYSLATPHRDLGLGQAVVGGRWYFSSPREFIDPFPTGRNATLGWTNNGHGLASPSTAPTSSIGWLNSSLHCAGFLFRCDQPSSHDGLPAATSHHHAPRP